MNKTEFDQLLACYGADFGHWPIEHRASAELALESHPEWQANLLESRLLDDALGQYSLEDHHLAAVKHRILAQTVYKQTFLDRFIHWLMPGEALWRPALIACLPIIIGLSIGLNIDIDEQYTLAEELSFTGLVAETATLTSILEVNDE